MESGLMALLTSALGGGVGGNLLGAVMKNRNMGPMWNTILGLVGGLAGGKVLGATMGGSLGGEAGAGAIGGIVLTLIGSFLKKKPATK